MRRRLLVVLSVVAAVVVGAWFTGRQGPLEAQAPAAANAPAPRTPWGDPDLQGIWSPGYYLTALERPNKYGGREFLTDDEVVELEKQASEAPGRNARLERGSTADVEGAYNDAFTGRGKKVIRTKRTSLIVEPADGKIPPLTPEAQSRAEASRRARALATPAELAAAFVDGDRTATPYPVDRTMGGGTANPEDCPADWCRGISLPFMGSSGTFSRFVQSRGWISIITRMATAAAPTVTFRSTGASTCPRRCANGSDTPSAAGTATRSSSTRRTSRTRPTFRALAATSTWWSATRARGRT